MRLLLALILASMFHAQGPDAKGTIRGRVTDAVTGAPIARAIVSLNSVENRPAVTLTDENGAYEFASVAAGAYRVMAEPPPYRAAHVPGTFVDPGQPAARYGLTLKAGEMRTRVDIALRRASAISGRVVDEWGLPVAGIMVGAGTQFAPRGSFSGPATDDRGLFRVAGLAPGRYFVCTDPQLFRRFSVIDTPPGVKSLPTCYPSATRETDAIRVAVGQADVDGIEIRIVRGRTFNVSGTVVDAAGMPPARASINVHRWFKGGSSSSGTSLSPDGRFTVKDLLPGEYFISAEAGDFPGDQARTERAAARVTIDASDVEGVSLLLARGALVRGRLIFEGGPVPPAQGSGFMISAVPPDQVDVSSVWQNAIARPDLSFELSGVVGPSVIVMRNIPASWVVESVKYDGREIVDTPARFTDRVSLEVLLTRRGGVLGGTVADDSGAPAAGRQVFLFPADSAKWRTVPPGSPRTTSLKGTFEFEARRQGEYLVAAVDDAAAPAYPKPDFFDRLSKVAERVVLGEGERRTIDLRVVKVPEDR